jgi:hypothetical protein
MSLINLALLAPLAFGQPQPEKFLEYSGHETACETEMAHLDEYALRVQQDSMRVAYVIAYGGRTGTARHEMSQTRSRIRRYLVKNRHIEPERVRIIDGGFRDYPTIELWLIDAGEKAPKPSGTIPQNQVKYIRTKQQFNCSSFY